MESTEETRWIVAVEKIRRTDLICKLLWWVGAFLSLSYCFGKGCDAYVKLQNDPPWLKLVLSITGLVVYLLGPAYLLAKIERRHRIFVEDYAGRISALEKAIDPGRTSSGLNPDGTEPKLEL